MPSWPRTFSWPTYSASVAGLSERSNCSSCVEPGLAEMSRSVSTVISGFCQRLQRRADAFGDADAGREALDRLQRFLLVVAQADQRVHHVRTAAGRGLRRRADFPLELQQQALGGLLADAGDLGELYCVLQRHR